MPRVLLVADADWVINDVRAALGVGGWEVEVLTDPHAALVTVETLGPEVVMADLQIASMGGMAVIREIRAGLDDGERPRLVLLLDRDADGFLARRAGADAWVVKPFEASRLREAAGVG